MILLPKEHGAYGQLALPLITALSAVGPSPAGLLLAISAIGAFVAHEPALILLGLRGSRAQRELRALAIRWLAVAAVVSAVAGALAVIILDDRVRWATAIPLIPALLLGTATLLGREKSWYGELSAALAFAGLSVPVAMAAGASARTGTTIAVPFALQFISSTLAVRTVVLRVRGGGDPSAAAATRQSAIAVTVVGAACLAVLTARDILPAAALFAATPGLATAFIIAARPPHASRLRTVGWTLAAVSVLTGLILVVTV